MPSKYHQRNFQPHSYHHIFNRGAHKNKIFHEKSDYKTFIEILSYYLIHPNGVPTSQLNRYEKQKPIKNPPYTLIAFALLENHFHFLFKQVLPEPTLTNIMRRLINTYVAYYNKKHNHSGALFEGKYKSILVKSEEQLLHLSRYIHQNPFNLAKHPYSSYPSYINKIQTPPWLHPEEILESLYFKNSKNPHKRYQKFVEEKPTSSSLSKTLKID